jgi:hypothetical protein
MVTIQIYQEQSEDMLSELTRELNLMYYASDVADKMQFQSVEEFHDAVKRAMEICLAAGLSVRRNFKQIYKCSPDGVTYDWKLSALGFQLVCLNGSPENPNTARMQINLLQDKNI